MMEWAFLILILLCQLQFTATSEVLHNSKIIYSARRKLLSQQKNSSTSDKGSVDEQLPEIHHHPGTHHHFIAHIDTFINTYSHVCQRQLSNCTFQSFQFDDNILKPSVLQHVLDSAMELQVEVNPEHQSRPTIMVSILLPTAFMTNNDLAALDEVLTVRPSWRVITELSAHSRFYLLLQLCPFDLMQYFLAVGKRSYPADPSICQHTPIAVSNHDGDTWGIRWTVAEECHNTLVDKLMLFHIYVKNMNDLDKNKEVYFASENECRDYDNKWNCLFLPTTSCPLPELLTDCQLAACYPYQYTVYEAATPKAAIVSPDKLESFVANYTASFGKAEEKVAMKESLKQPRVANFAIIRPTGTPYRTQADIIFSEATSERRTREGSDFMENYAYYLGVATRFNVKFRMGIQNLVDNFRSSFKVPFTMTTECVAVHIRMDDRVIEGVDDMIKWCNQCAIMNENGVSRRGYNSSSNCTETDFYDKGCMSPLPFGSLKLEHFLNASQVLFPDIHHIYIMTDDMKWLHEQLHEFHQKVHPLPANNTDSNSNSNSKLNLYPFPIRPRHRAKSFRAAEDFWASISLAQQCRGFVGHFGSAATQIIYRSMCYYHNHRFMTCPPLFDLANVA